MKYIIFGNQTTCDNREKNAETRSCIFRLRSRFRRLKLSHRLSEMCTVLHRIHKCHSLRDIGEKAECVRTLASV